MPRVKYYFEQTIETRYISISPDINGPWIHARSIQIFTPRGYLDRAALTLLDQSLFDSCVRKEIRVSRFDLSERARAKIYFGQLDSSPPVDI